MPATIYVSCNFADRKIFKEVEQMVARLKGAGDNNFVLVENDVSYNGDTAIQWELEQLMSDCDAALFVLGDNPRTSPWLDKEASLAIARELPMVVSFLPDIECSEPAFMSQVSCINATWQADVLRSALGDCRVPM